MRRPGTCEEGAAAPARDQRGAAAAELALFLPLLVLVLLGAIDFGRFAYAAITVSNAARAGAAYCAYNNCSNSTADDIRRVAREEAWPYLDIPATPTYVEVPVVTSGAGCSVSDPCPGVTSGPGCSSSRPCLRVRVRYPFTTLIPWPGIPSAITVARSAQFVTDILTP